MNRKERRAANKRRGVDARTPSAPALGPAGASIAELSAEASRQHREGRLREAQEICRQILAREPAHLQSLNLLGVMVQASGDHRTAVKMFARALAADELNAACHYNIGNSYQALGRRTEALAHFKKALTFGMDEKAVAEFILQGPVVASCVARIADKWPLPVKREELFGPKGVAPLAGDLFLRCALQSITLQSVPLEALLTSARAALLWLANGQDAEAADIDDDLVGFACALAQQCFINEYVYAQDAEETRLATTLRDRLQDSAPGAGVTPLALAVVAAYVPLHTLPMAEALLRWQRPAVLSDLLQQQLDEPLEEMRERTAIPALTPVKDSVSLDVMRQYQDNPYPRWTINPLAAFADDQARGKTISTAERQAELEILIAGCGTGLHAIQVAQLYPNARVLAVDISLTSLAYARRKTRQLGLRNIDYAQADILELGGIGRTFDRIESVGVLHHLAAPKIGWRVLVALLRPGGNMRIGLYSAAARRVIVEARARIAERGYQATAADIRTCRQDIIREAQRWKWLIGARDFYSMSGCRDLLFNVMEHRFTIPEIATFLDANDLSFTGFEFLEDEVAQSFQRQFREAAALSDLDRWQAFEADYPQTFWGMYLFTLRKNER